MYTNLEMKRVTGGAGFKISSSIFKRYIMLRFWVNDLWKGSLPKRKI